MTDPTIPTTEAGRALLAYAEAVDWPQQIVVDILAIEAEAAASALSALRAEVRTLSENADLAYGSHQHDRHGGLNPERPCSDCRRFAAVLAAIDRLAKAEPEARQTPRAPGPGVCAECGEPWPCQPFRDYDGDGDFGHYRLAKAEPEGESRLHDWTTDDKHDYEWCRVCLRVRQANGSSDSKPCKGPARVELREEGESRG